MSVKNQYAQPVESVGYTRAISVFWPNAGTGSAPDAANFPEGTIGADADGATTASLYHVVNVSGTPTWVDTGASVLYLYGGA